MFVFPYTWTGRDHLSKFMGHYMYYERMLRCFEALELTMKVFEKTSKQPAINQEALALVKSSTVPRSGMMDLSCLRSSQ